MSRFLAPIHFLMYDKVLFLEAFVENYIDIAKDNNVELKELNSLGEIEKSPLDRIIDEDNIHLWIQKKVEIVENRFAYVVSEILKSDKELMIELLKYSYRKGRNENFNSNVDDAFKFIISRFLDGMPCDNSISIIESNEDFVKFIIEIDNHEKFWEYGISSETYWEIRNKYIKGLLSSSRYDLFVENNIYEIRG